MAGKRQNTVSDDVLFLPPDDGAGEHIAAIYNPELMAAKRPAEEACCQFLKNALATCQALGDDTPLLRA